MSRPLNLAEFENETDIGAYILDFRPGDQFINGFIPGSFYMCQAFVASGLSAEIISVNENIVVVTPKTREESAMKSLQKLGYENFDGWLKGGFETWKESGNTIDLIISIEADELLMDMKFDDPQVIDIRSKEDYDINHLEGAENIPPLNLLYNLEELPRETTFYMYCDDGEMSTSIISVLKNHGFHNFYHITGGYEALRRVI